MSTVAAAPSAAADPLRGFLPVHVDMLKRVDRAPADIHPWAKLVSVVDVFDAMTGKRPYRKSITVAEALQFIERNAGTHFDQEMAQCWISAMRKA